MKEEILKSHFFPVASPVFAESVAGQVGTRRALPIPPVKTHLSCAK